MKCWLYLCAVLSFVSLSISTAAPLKVGDAIPAIQAKDQFGTNYTFTNGTKYILVAVEMEVGKAANHKLSDQGVGYLDKHGAVFLMDIHTMPGIARVFALPKMRKYQHKIILMDKADSMGWVPLQVGRVTVIALTLDGKVKAVKYWDPVTEGVAGVFDP